MIPIVFSFSFQVRFFCEDERVDIMSKLRNREHISLNEVYSKIISSADFKATHKAQPEEKMEKMNPALVTKQNMDFLKNNLLQYANTFIIQEDRGEGLCVLYVASSHQIFFSNNYSLQMKSMQDEETCINILKDMLLSRMKLISWPSRFEEGD